jgi:hypothetical protein
MLNYEKVYQNRTDAPMQRKSPTYTNISILKTKIHCNNLTRFGHALIWPTKLSFSKRRHTALHV